MHHKRKRAPNQRGGCGMCKPHKMSHFKQDEISKTGFGKVRRKLATDERLDEIRTSR